MDRGRSARVPGRPAAFALGADVRGETRRLLRAAPRSTTAPLRSCTSACSRCSWAAAWAGTCSPKPSSGPGPAARRACGSTPAASTTRRDRQLPQSRFHDLQNRAVRRALTLRAGCTGQALLLTRLDRAPLWTPSPDRIAASRMTAFMRGIEARYRVAIPRLRVAATISRSTRIDDFWRLMWEFGDIRGTMGARIVEHADRMPGARFFPDATLNFAENLLRAPDDGLAIVFNGEGQPSRTLTFGELRAVVARICRRTAARRDPARRSRGRLRPQHPRSDRRRAWRRGRRRRLVLVLARLRRAGRPRSVRPDRAEDPRRRGRILLRRQAHDALSQVDEIVACAAVGRADDRRPVSRRPLGGRTGRMRSSRTVGRVRLARAPPDDFRFEPLPFNHPLYIMYLLGHDRRSQVHRPWRRRDADPAPARSTSSTATSSAAIASSTSRPAAG